MAFTATAPNSKIGAVLSTTLRAIAPNIADNVTDDLVLFHWLTAKGHKKYYDGGQAIALPVMLALNSTAGSYRGYDIGDASPQEGITQAIYPWRQNRVFISISGLEDFQNGGEYAVASLVATKVDQGVISLQDTLNSQGFGDGTGNDYKDILGLQAIVHEVPASNTVGMISTSNTKWRNKVKDMNGATTDTHVQMRKMWNNCSKGRMHPTILIGTQGAYEAYEGFLTSNERYVDRDVVSGDFEGLLFKGSPFFFDADCPDWSTGVTSGAETILFLNHHHLWWAVARGADFTPTDFMMSPQQDAYVSCIKCYGNLVTDLRSVHGVLYDISSAATS